jgi:hypothetical protein
VRECALRRVKLLPWRGSNGAARAQRPRTCDSRRFRQTATCHRPRALLLCVTPRHSRWLTRRRSRASPAAP